MQFWMQVTKLFHKIEPSPNLLLVHQVMPVFKTICLSVTLKFFGHFQQKLEESFQQ